YARTRKKIRTGSGGCGYQTFTSPPHSLARSASGMNMSAYMIPASLLRWTPLLSFLWMPLACGSDSPASETQTDQTTSTEPGTEPSATGDDTTVDVSPAGGTGPGEPCDPAQRLGSFRLYLGADRTILT